jgi:hypothetical protein
MKYIRAARRGGRLKTGGTQDSGSIRKGPAEVLIKEKAGKRLHLPASSNQHSRENGKPGI